MSEFVTASQVLEDKGDNTYNVQWYNRRPGSDSSLAARFTAGQASEEKITMSNIVHVFANLTARGLIPALDKTAIRGQVQRSELERINGETFCFLCKQDKEEDVAVECDTCSCPRRFHRSCVGEGGVMCALDCCEEHPAPVFDPDDIVAQLEN